MKKYYIISSDNMQPFQYFDDYNYACEVAKRKSLANINAIYFICESPQQKDTPTTAIRCYFQGKFSVCDAANPSP